ncbi:MAG: RNA methyltransferase [Lachnospiraceae bacterium]|jgi:TrmH family RNA methyltransferase|nr:hypothetical protein C819_02184 [Lachnospiraceae bacterium 10-1]MCX4353149.1 RNA methyltransferase [Lachnospiraceae bacterium]
MITSLTNRKIKLIASLRDRSRRRSKEGLFIAEGIKMFEETPIQCLKEIYVSELTWPELKEDKALWKRLCACMEAKVHVEQVSEEVFRETSDTQTPQGILLVLEQFSYQIEDLIEKAKAKQKAQGKAPLFLLLEDIQDPGNLGTMIRTGEGAGVDGVIMSKGTVDIYNPKTVRATMGSLYRVPFVYTEDLGGEIKRLQENKIKVYAAHLNGKKLYDQVTYKGGSAFLIGNEGNGLCEETAKLANVCLKIPMEGELESLNAAVAASLLLYQAAGSQRKQ